MNTRRRIISAVGLMILSACTLPGSISPTPFAFPTANLTLTQILAPTATLSPIPPTEAIPELTTSTLPASAPSPAVGMPTPTLSIDLEQRPNGVILRAERLLDAPTIDGDLSEWGNSPYPVNQVTYGRISWSGEQDASGSFQVGWDMENLYFAVKVTDDTFVQISSGKYLFRGDSIEIQFDADLSSDFTSSILNTDDFQIGVTPGNFGSLPSGLYRWFPASLAGPLLNASSAAMKHSDGYQLEGSIPWSTFGITPVLSTSFGFTLSISDNDAAGTASQQTLVSSVSTRMLTDPTTWGTLLLVDAP